MTSTSLTVQDILADLAILCPESVTATTRHPVLSLGRSLVPADQLSSSEQPREAIRDSNNTGLQDFHGKSRVDHLLQLLESQDATSIPDPSLRFQLIEAFLASSKETLQLNEAAMVTNGNGSGDKRVDRLNQRIASLQSQMDLVEKRLVEAKDELDKTQDTRSPMGGV